MRHGRVRDALATLGNLQGVMSSRSRELADDEIDELRQGLAWLRDAFAHAVTEAPSEQRAAREALDAFAAGRVAVVEAALVDMAAGSAPDALGAAAVELEASAALLELAERATDAMSVEVSVATLAEQALQLAWAVRSHGAVPVYVRASVEDCSVSCDAHVVSRVLAIAVAQVLETASAVVVQTHVEDDAGVIEVRGRSAEDEGADVKQTRLIPRIPPTGAVLEAAARSAGLGLVVEPGRVLVRCPRLS